MEQDNFKLKARLRPKVLELVSIKPNVRLRAALGLTRKLEAVMRCEAGLFYLSLKEPRKSGIYGLSPSMVRRIYVYIIHGC